MIGFLFNILFFVIPLVFLKNTSELFEFNKIVVVYIFTTLITTFWLIKSIQQRKFIFKKTLLDWPLVIYLSVLLISTLLSIDPRTSWLGYYSRFNGGLVSQFCYAILYWVFVSNNDKKQTLSSIKYLIFGTLIASVLAILEHFGFFITCGVMKFGWQSSCWVQDVQNRVFSTLGQPNWLAALIVAILPIVWSEMIYETGNVKKNNNSSSKAVFKKFLNFVIKKINFRFAIYLIISIVFFVTLLFTKSRSGLLAFGIEAIIFWGLQVWMTKLKYLKAILALALISVGLFFSINSGFLNVKQPVIDIPASPALESGGTESGTIRKYVWIGAFEVFKHHPIFGTGPETFAFSFPTYKPIGHNLTSEWDFIYNKAHNEFLNYLANTGLLGFASYLSLIIYSLIILWKSKRFDFLAGYIAILVTNFFGFSVVPVSLLFYVFPAMALVISIDEKIHLNKTRLKIIEKLGIVLIFCLSGYVLYLIYVYWNADVFYNKARSLNRSNKQDQAITEINKSISFSKNESIYISELSLADGKVETAMNAFKLTPYNQNVRKILINNLVKSAGETPDNLLVAENVILDGIDKSPNDPKLYYQLGVLQLKISKNDEAVKNLERSVQLKPNYKEGHYALGMTYKALKENEKAKIQFEYIIRNIDPSDELTKKNLEELN